MGRVYIGCTVHGQCKLAETPLRRHHWKKLFLWYGWSQRCINLLNSVTISHFSIFLLAYIQWSVITEHTLHSGLVWGRSHHSTWLERILQLQFQRGGEEGAWEICMLMLSATYHTFNTIGTKYFCLTHQYLTMCSHTTVITIFHSLKIMCV